MVNIPIITPLWKAIKMAWTIGYRYPKAVAEVKKAEQARQEEEEGAHTTCLPPDVNKDAVKKE